MSMLMPAHETPPDVNGDGPGKLTRIVIWQDGPTQLDCHWGLRPFTPGGRSYSLLRAEARAIERPCLIIANEFFVTPDASRKRYRVRLVTDESFFCFAGIWAPATADWPVSFAALTVDSSPDIAALKDRHMAIVRPEDWEAWLRQTRPSEEILRPFPPGSFNIDPPHGKKGAGNLFDF
jgi:putative SOS response-associated peptidase YedK